jgi:hypothetical protein
VAARGCINFTQLAISLRSIGLLQLETPMRIGKTRNSPKFARKAKAKLQEVDPTAVVFSPGAAVNESNHFALRN